jgi:aspartyl-tRNA(Asn)/glutamyl-tRNA(Gln) amidotransferase subunit C
MDIQELEETAVLARLNTGRDELAAALPAFEQMLGFFALMQEADKDAALAAPLSLDPGQAASAFLVNAAHFRDGGAAAETADGGRLLDAAGERDGRFIVIPNVL